MRWKNVIYTFKDIFFFKTLEKNLADCKSVLDVGCGGNSPIGQIKKHFIAEGIDIFKPSIKESKQKHTHDTYKIGDINNINKYYKKNSFDAVISLDVIEHLEKKEAIVLIKKMETIAKKKVILLTPNGFYHQDHLDGNPHQEHKSGWSTKDLEALGYKVYGLRGLKYIRGEYATIQYKPWFFWGSIAFFSEYLFYFIPQLSYHLFAVKKVSDEK